MNLVDIRENVQSKRIYSIIKDNSNLLLLPDQDVLKVL